VSGVSSIVSEKSLKLPGGGKVWANACRGSIAIARQQAPEQKSVADKMVNIIFFMFLPGVEDNRTADSLSVGVDP